MNEQQFEKMKSGRGFIAALDQSDSEFDATLTESIESIYAASIT